jgi:hypothetical protein
MSYDLPRRLQLLLLCIHICQILASAYQQIPLQLLKNYHEKSHVPKSWSIVHHSHFSVTQSTSGHNNKLFLLFQSWKEKFLMTSGNLGILIDDSLMW